MTTTAESTLIFLPKNVSASYIFNFTYLRDDEIKVYLMVNDIISVPLFELILGINFNLDQNVGAGGTINVIDQTGLEISYPNFNFIRIERKTALSQNIPQGNSYSGTSVMAADDNLSRQIQDLDSLISGLEDSNNRFPDIIPLNDGWFLRIDATNKKFYPFYLLQENTPADTKPWAGGAVTVATDGSLLLNNNKVPVTLPTAADIGKYLKARTTSRADPLEYVTLVSDPDLIAELDKKQDKFADGTNPTDVIAWVTDKWEGADVVLIISPFYYNKNEIDVIVNGLKDLIDGKQDRLPRGVDSDQILSWDNSRTVLDWVAKDDKSFLDPKFIAKSKLQGSSGVLSGCNITISGGDNNVINVGSGSFEIYNSLKNRILQFPRIGDSVSTKTWTIALASALPPSGIHDDYYLVCIRNDDQGELVINPNDLILELLTQEEYDTLKNTLVGGHPAHLNYCVVGRVYVDNKNTNVGEIPTINHFVPIKKNLNRIHDQINDVVELFGNLTNSTVSGNIGQATLRRDEGETTGYGSKEINISSPTNQFKSPVTASDILGFSVYVPNGTYVAIVPTTILPVRYWNGTALTLVSANAWGWFLVGIYAGSDDSIVFYYDKETTETPTVEQAKVVFREIKAFFPKRFVGLAFQAMIAIKGAAIIFEYTNHYKFQLLGASGDIGGGAVTPPSTTEDVRALTNEGGIYEGMVLSLRYSSFNGVLVRIGAGSGKIYSALQNAYIAFSRSISEIPLSTYVPSMPYAKAYRIYIVNDAMDGQTIVFEDDSTQQTYFNTRVLLGRLIMESLDATPQEPNPRALYISSKGQNLNTNFRQLHSYVQGRGYFTNIELFGGVGTNVVSRTAGYIEGFGIQNMPDQLNQSRDVFRLDLITNNRCRLVFWDNYSYGDFAATARIPVFFYRGTNDGVQIAVAAGKYGIYLGALCLSSPEIGTPTPNGDMQYAFPFEAELDDWDDDTLLAAYERYKVLYASLLPHVLVQGIIAIEGAATGFTTTNWKWFSLNGTVSTGGGSTGGGNLPPITTVGDFIRATSTTTFSTDGVADNLPVSATNRTSTKAYIDALTIVGTIYYYDLADIGLTDASFNGDGSNDIEIIFNAMVDNSELTISVDSVLNPNLWLDLPQNDLPQNGVAQLRVLRLSPTDSRTTAFTKGIWFISYTHPIAIPENPINWELIRENPDFVPNIIDGTVSGETAIWNAANARYEGVLKTGDNTIISTNLSPKSIKTYIEENDAAIAARIDNMEFKLPDSDKPDVFWKQLVTGTSAMQGWGVVRELPISTNNRDILVWNDVSKAWDLTQDLATIDTRITRVENLLPAPTQAQIDNENSLIPTTLTTANWAGTQGTGGTDTGSTDISDIINAYLKSGVVGEFIYSNNNANQFYHVEDEIYETGTFSRVLQCQGQVVSKTKFLGLHKYCNIDYNTVIPSNPVIGSSYTITISPYYTQVAGFVARARGLSPNLLNDGGNKIEILAWSSMSSSNDNPFFSRATITQAATEMVENWGIGLTRPLVGYYPRFYAHSSDKDLNIQIGAAGTNFKIFISSSNYEPHYFDLTKVTTGDTQGGVIFFYVIVTNNKIIIIRIWHDYKMYVFDMPNQADTVTERPEEDFGDFAMMDQRTRRVASGNLTIQITDNIYFLIGIEAFTAPNALPAQAINIVSINTDTLVRTKIDNAQLKISPIYTNNGGYMIVDCGLFDSINNRLLIYTREGLNGTVNSREYIMDVTPTSISNVVKNSMTTGTIVNIKKCPLDPNLVVRGRVPSVRTIMYLDLSLDAGSNYTDNVLTLNWRGGYAGLTTDYVFSPLNTTQDTNYINFYYDVASNLIKLLGIDPYYDPSVNAPNSGLRAIIFTPQVRFNGLSFITPINALKLDERFMYATEHYLYPICITNTDIYIHKVTADRKLQRVHTLDLVLDEPRLPASDVYNVKWVISGNAIDTTETIRFLILDTDTELISFVIPKAANATICSGWGFFTGNKFVYLSSTGGYVYTPTVTGNTTTISEKMVDITGLGIVFSSFINNFLTIKFRDNQFLIFQSYQFGTSYTLDVISFHNIRDTFTRIDNIALQSANTSSTTQVIIDSAGYSEVRSKVYVNFRYSTTRETNTLEFDISDNVIINPSITNRGFIVPDTALSTDESIGMRLRLDSTNLKKGYAEVTFDAQKNWTEIREVDSAGTASVDLIELDSSRDYEYLEFHPYSDDVYLGGISVDSVTSAHSISNLNVATIARSSLAYKMQDIQDPKTVYMRTNEKMWLTLTAPIMPTTFANTKLNKIQSLIPLNTNQRGIELMNITDGAVVPVVYKEPDHIPSAIVNFDFIAYNKDCLIVGVNGIWYARNKISYHYLGGNIPSNFTYTCSCYLRENEFLIGGYIAGVETRIYKIGIGYPSFGTYQLIYQEMSTTSYITDIDSSSTTIFATHSVLPKIIQIDIQTLGIGTPAILDICDRVTVAGDTAYLLSSDKKRVLRFVPQATDVLLLTATGANLFNDFDSSVAVLAVVSSAGDVHKLLNPATNNTWETVVTLPTNPVLLGISISPDTSNSMIVHTNGQIYYSNDTGQSFSLLSTGQLPAGNINKIVLTSSNVTTHMLINIGSQAYSFFSDNFAGTALHSFIESRLPADPALDMFIGVSANGVLGAIPFNKPWKSTRLSVDPIEGVQDLTFSGYQALLFKDQTHEVLLASDNGLVGISRNNYTTKFTLVANSPNVPFGGGFCATKTDNLVAWGGVDGNIIATANNFTVNVNIDLFPQGTVIKGMTPYLNYDVRVITNHLTELSRVDMIDLELAALVINNESYVSPVLTTKFNCLTEFPNGYVVGCSTGSLVIFDRTLPTGSQFIIDDSLIIHGAIKQVRYDDVYQVIYLVANTKTYFKLASNLRLIGGWEHYTTKNDNIEIFDCLINKDRTQGIIGSVLYNNSWRLFRS